MKHNFIVRRKFGVLVALIFGALPSTAFAQERGQYEVVGVQAEEFLKMRAGPGTGFKVLLGLPEGTILQLYSCERAGHTSWCKISLKNEPSVKGYVSSAYLQKR